MLFQLCKNHNIQNALYEKREEQYGWIEIIFSRDNLTISKAVFYIKITKQYISFVLKQHLPIQQ